MLKPGVFVVQYLNASHRYGVIISKKKEESDFGWSYFKVRWSDGSTSTERTDCLKTGKKIDSIVSDLIGLKKYCK